MPRLDYYALTTEYTNKILTEIATKSPTRIFSSVSVAPDLLKSGNDEQRQHLDKIYKNLVASSDYRPYLTTTTFKRIPLSPTGMRQRYRFFTESTWTKYSDAYRHLLSNLTNHFDKKPHLQPITFDFFDVPGTRHSRYARFTESTIPHIHSIYLVHKKTVPAFEYHIETEFHLITKHHSFCEFIQTMHSKPITEDLYKVVSYCSKLYNNVYVDKYRFSEEYDLFNQFPITDKRKKDLASNREELRYQRIANKIFEDSYRYECEYNEMKAMRREVRKRFNLS